MQLFLIIPFVESLFVICKIFDFLMLPRNDIHPLLSLSGSAENQTVPVLPETRMGRRFGKWKKGSGTGRKLSFRTFPDP